MASEILSGSKDQNFNCEYYLTKYEQVNEKTLTNIGLW